MKVVTIIGARPQFVKAAVVSRELALRPGVTEVLVHTGQHYDANMSDIFLDELKIPKPKYFLGIGSLPHGAQTGRMLEKIEEVLQTENPDWLLVYGDTNSTLAGALAAAKLHVKVAHVEAGLRSFNRRMPEEINRVMADHVSTLLFAPTDTAVKHLASEGIVGERVLQVGDVMQDAARVFGEFASSRSSVIERLGLKPGGYVLSTIHRAESTDDPRLMGMILEGLFAVAQDCPVVLPLHPRTRNVLAKAGKLGELEAKLRVTEPLGYLDMLQLERHARVIATDSGGVQKEAYFCGVPCVTLRTETEWTELVELGWNRLADLASGAGVARSIREAMGSRGRQGVRPFGDGVAAQAIADALAAGMGAHP